MMPAAFADPWERHLAEPTLEFMSEHQANDEFTAIRTAAFASSNRGRENVRRVRRVLLPVDVVVILAADHQRIRQRRRYGIDLVSCPDDRARPTPGNLVQNFQRKRHVMLLEPAERASD